MSGANASSDRRVAFFTAIVAVLAALATLFAQHRSSTALALRNQAILLTAQASDQYTYYQTQQLKAAFDRSAIAIAPERAGALRGPMTREERTSIATAARAKELEASAERAQTRADVLLHSFETLEISTALFEIAIAFASVAALTHARFTLTAGGVLALAGLVTGLIGYAQGL